jgi:hypothetical protein
LSGAQHAPWSQQGIRTAQHAGQQASPWMQQANILVQQSGCCAGTEPSKPSESTNPLTMFVNIVLLQSKMKKLINHERTDGAGTYKTSIHDL